MSEQAHRYHLRKRRLLHARDDYVYIIDRSADGKTNIERLHPITDDEAQRLCDEQDAYTARVRAQREADRYREQREGDS